MKHLSLLHNHIKENNNYCGVGNKTIDFCHNDSKIIFHAMARHVHFLFESISTSPLKLHPLPDRTNPKLLATDLVCDNFDRQYY